MKINNNLISSDRPITSCLEDRLGRAPLAAFLADTICNWTSGKDSIVIGLYGDWGSGKTSLKGMILETLSQRELSPAVLEFNPWNWTAQDKVSEAFYREIEVTLGKEDITDKARTAAERWRRYKEALELGNVFVEATEWLSGTTLRDSILSVALILGTLIGVSIRSVKIWIVTAILFLLAAFVRFGTKLFTYIYNQKTAAASKRTLPELRKELEVSLRRLQRSILVVIDDVDRLPAADIREVIQLIKANANLPNLIYLLLCERRMVEHALDAQTAGHGREFLEKIVQVHFDLPAIERARIDHLLHSRIDAMVTELGIPFDRARWAALNRIGLAAQFGSFRNVYRFLSTLTFHMSLFQKETLFEVNLIDLIGLEILRTFAPDIYRLVRENKAAFTGQVSHKTVLEMLGKQQLKRKQSEWRIKRIRSLLAFLFPVLDMPTITPDDFHGFASTLRVCSPQYFGRYFLFRSPDDDISEMKFTQIISTGDKAILQQQISDLTAGNLLGLLIDRVRLRLDQINMNNIAVMIAALFDAEDELLKGNSEEASLWRNGIALIRDLLRKIEDDISRSNTLKHAFHLAEGGMALVMDVLFDDDQSSEFFPAPQLFSLRELWAHKVAVGAYSGRLPRSKETMRMIAYWRDVSPAIFDLWLERCNREEFFHFLSAYLLNAGNAKSKEGVQGCDLALADLNRVIPVHRLEERVEIDYFPPITEREKLLLDFNPEGMELLSDKDGRWPLSGPISR